MKTNNLRFESLERREVFTSGLCEMVEPEIAQIDSYRVEEEMFDFLRDVYAEQRDLLRSEEFMADPEINPDGRLGPWILAANGTDDILANNRADEINVVYDETTDSNLILLRFGEQWVIGGADPDPPPPGDPPAPEGPSDPGGEGGWFKNLFRKKK